MSESEKAIVFGGKADPNDEAAYKAKIEAAKKGGVNSLKGTTPLGHVERPAIPPLASQPQHGGQSDGLVDGGVKPRPAGSPILSAATEEQLRQAAQAMNVPATEEAKVEEKKEEKKTDDDLFSLFDFDGKNEAERVLNNKKRREFIEKHCSEMNFEDLLMRDEVQQVVAIKPKQFEVTFRSLKPSESLFVKQFMSSEMQKTEAYYLEKFTLCQLCMAIVAINGKQFGAPHEKADGEISQEVFETRLRKLLKMSGYIVADLALNYAWFDIRVRKLLLADELGNG